MPRHPLVRRVNVFLRREKVSGGMVVAVSGGPDSVALLRALVELGHPVVVAHLNHQLRGHDSDHDEDFVRTLAESLHLDFHGTRVDVASRAQGANLEATARRLRYDWLGQVAITCGLAHVATGHTANDQAETVLHRLLRGTGWQGLRGIAARRPLADRVELVRPLLDVTRAQVVDYLTTLGQSACHDSSNDDIRLTRNRLRHELLQHLQKRYNPKIVAVLGRLARQADEEFRLRQRDAQALLLAAERPRAGSQIVLDRGCLSTASRPLLRAMFRQLWAREGWPVARMGFDDWERLADLATSRSGAVDLTGRLHAASRDRVLLVGPQSRESDVQHRLS
jgi:tRNA(Ile)-lysidine synthase